jgi:zinc protease
LHAQFKSIFLFQGAKVFQLHLKLRPFCTIFFFTILLTALAGFSGASISSNRESSSSCFSTKWPSELSQLVGDPSIVRGRLDNGFRYVIKKNKEPANRVAIYLDVQAGSLNEQDNQQGVAHFLEHMLFNGSTNFPPGSLVDYFQSLGMNFGGDTNAHTTHEETVYNIFLPNGSKKDIDAGFLVMSDYARGALLTDKEIDKERGVILAEKRARDSAGYRNYVAETGFALRGTRYPKRMPIGVQTTLEKADHALLKSFYDDWYRPENMILVVVGDINPEITKDLIEKHFSKLSSAGPEPQCPDFGKLAHQEVESFYHYEPELGKTRVAIQAYRDVSIENDSLLLEKKSLLKMMGTMIMGYRLQRIQEEGKAPFSDVNYYSGDIARRIQYAALSAQVDPIHWQETVSSLDQILRQAIEQGFTEKEVERAKKEIFAQLDAQILTEGSEDSRTIAQRIIEHLNNNRVYQSAEQEKLLYGPITEGVTVADVNGVFRDLWGNSSRLVSVSGDVSLGEDGAEIVAAVYKNATRKATEVSIVDKKHMFPYLQPPLSVGPPKISHVKDIDVEKLVFPNGLIVNLKKTSFEKNRIRVRANFGAGKQDEKLPGMALLLADVINGSGSGKLTRSEIDEVLAGSSVEMSFRVDESAYSWTGEVLARDFDLFGNVLYHLLLDPGLRKNVFTTVKGNYELMYQKISHEIEGALPLKVLPFLADFNKKFGLPALDDVEKLDYDTLAHWAQPLIRPKDLEISIVGDFNRDDVVSVLTRYLSGIEFLPAKKLATNPVQFPAGKKLDVKVTTDVEKSLVVVAWPTDDFWSIHRTRRLQLLARVFGDRLRKIIREKLAASYSPNVSSFNSRVYPGYGYIISQMLVKSGAEDTVINKILQISNQLESAGITSEELVNAKGPFLTSLKDSIRTNQYWLNSVLSLSSRYPQQLDWPTTIMSDYSSINQSEINKLATRYLADEGTAVARVTPEKREKDRAVALDKKMLEKSFQELQ